MTTGMEQVDDNHFTGYSDCGTQLVTSRHDVCFPELLLFKPCLHGRIDAFMHCFLECIAS